MISESEFVRLSEGPLRFILLLLAMSLLLSCTEPKNSMSVTATAYNSVPSQTQGDPEIAAWGDRLDDNVQSIAVSRDLLELGLTHNVEVEIDGMPGTWLVRDKLNKRFTERIDIYMGKDIDAAREFGKQTLTIHWKRSGDR